MRHGTVLSTSDESFETAKEWVELHRDTFGTNPMEDYDQLFEIWSNIPREIGSSKGAECPYEEILDDEGYGNGKYQIREGIIAVPVSAYIHSGIHLSVGSIRCMFGDTPVRPGGRGWDTTPDALFLYTYKRLWEKMMGEGSWMKVRVNPGDENDCSLRPATKEEFEEYVEKQAGYLVKELNLAEEGSVFGYTTHKRVHYKRVDDDGTETDCWETQDGQESCWGFLTDKVGDIDFPRDLPVYADPDGDCQWFVGDEYDIPEFVVTQVVDGKREYLKDYTANAKGECLASEWTHDLEEAHTYISWWQAQSVAQKVIRKEDYYAKRNCVEKDKLKDDYGTQVTEKA